MYLLSRYNQDVNGAASIGIIGSADGPTTILVIDTVAQSYIPVFSFLFIAGIVYFVIMKLRTNKK